MPLHLKDIQWKSVLLLAVFLVGGVGAPLVHPFHHAHDAEHRHGQAAADFSWFGVATPEHEKADFFVEERTPFQELNCELCARLAYDADTFSQDTDPFSAHVSYTDTSEKYLQGRSGRHLSIRAPPVPA